MKGNNIMTEQQLKERVDVHHTNSYGVYKVTIVYRGKKYHCSSHNCFAYDGLDTGAYGRTSKQAYQAFYNECKEKNNLK